MLPAHRIVSYRFLGLAVLIVLPVACALSGCGGPDAASCPDPMELATGVAADSLGIDGFLALDADERAARRERARRWLRQADRESSTRGRARAWTAAASLAPDDPEPWLDLAEIWYALGDDFHTEKSLDNAAAAVRHLDSGADFDASRLQRGEAAGRTARLRAWYHYRRAEWFEGLDWARAAVKVKAGDEFAWQVQGLLEASRRNYSASREIAADLQRLDQFDSNVAWIHAMYERAKGRHQVAFDYIVRSRPDHFRACEFWRDMGLVAEYLGHWSYARRWYGESGAALTVKDATCVHRVDHVRLGPVGEAETMPVWLALGSHYVTGSLSAYTALALDRFDAAADEEARTRWGAAVVNSVGVLLRREEERAWALRARGLVFVDRERLQRGREDLVEAARLLVAEDVVDGRLEADLGHAWLGLEKHERALPHLRRALETGFETAGTWSDLGLVLVMDGDPEEARSCFDRALELDAELVTAWYNRGLLSLHGRDHAAAEADLGEAARLAPDNADIAQLLQQVRLSRLQESADQP